MNRKNTKAGHKILIVDDEPAAAHGLGELVRAQGYTVETCTEAPAALREIKTGDYALVISDLKMPELDGLELLAEMRNSGITTEVIIVTGQATVETAVEAMRAGAYDYLMKPVDSTRLRSVVPKALERFDLVRQNQQLRSDLDRLSRYDDLIGASVQIQEVYRTIDAVADSTANVVITGESGTGKELVARALHRKSSRAGHRFVAVNCASLPEQILENELFGHEKGAFTGALIKKAGCFEMAHRGTLFLDEIAEMPLETQAKILRALEERKFRRLGGQQEIEVDIRIVAATNREVKQAVAEGRLREDLYYRLCVVVMHMPPLRDRDGDVPLLASSFLENFAEKNNKKLKGFTRACMDALTRYSWPGNVRELRNVVERAVIMSRGANLDVLDLPPDVLDSADDTRNVTIPLGTSLAEVERMLILRTLTANNNNKVRTAKVLGVTAKTLHNKLRQYEKTT